MRCSKCGHTVNLGKNVRPTEKSVPDECPECGEPISKSEGGRDLIQK